jgi:hypothetical protein
MKRFLDFFCLLFLLVLAVASHWQWFNPASVLNCSDWSFWPDAAAKQLLNSYGAWINFFNFGAANVQTPFNLFTAAWSALANLNFSYDNAVKITLLIPIAIFGFFSPYIFFKKLTNNHLAALAAAAFYGTTTHFLVRQTAHLTIAFVYSITPLIFYFFVKALEKNRRLDWLVFTIIYWISICYEIRIAYIITLLLVFYFIFFCIRGWRKFIGNVAMSCFLLLGLSMFWILPTVCGGFSQSISTIANRGLFGNMLFDLRNAFTLSESAWTGGMLNYQFVKQPVLWYLWFVPLIIFSLLLMRPGSNKEKKEILFFAILSLLGVFFTKQSDGPLPGAYLWLYNNFPGFNLFREASKLYLITALGYSGMIAYVLLFLWRLRRKMAGKIFFSCFFMAIIVVSFLNVYPLVTGKIRAMFVSRNLPADYSLLEDFIYRQHTYFRTFWVPACSRWGFFDDQNPKISDSKVIGSDWKNFVVATNQKEPLVQNRLLNIFTPSASAGLFDSASIKYVIVPISDVANDDNPFVSYGGNNGLEIRSWYISQLDKVSWLKKINIGAKDLVVYENEDYSPLVYTADKLDYYQTNASDFIVKDGGQRIYLNFNWKNGSYLTENVSSAVVPIEADAENVSQLQAAIDSTDDAKEKTVLQNKLNLYVSNLFFQNFQLSIPAKGKYGIYFRPESVLADNDDVGVLIDGQLLKKVSSTTNNDGWKYFNELNLDSGKHSFEFYYGGSRMNYINSGDIVLYAADLAPEIKAPHLEYRQINPTKYVVKVSGASQSFPLFFSDAFHSGWKLYLEENQSDKGDKFIGQERNNSKQNENLSAGRFYDLLFRQSVLNDRHFIANGYANGWWVDLNKLNGSGDVLKNADGSYDFSLTIEFEPQKYFYMGIFISVGTLLLCLAVLFYSLCLLRYNKKRQSILRSS